jgi:hypothetical protein
MRKSKRAFSVYKSGAKGQGIYSKGVKIVHDFLRGTRV